MEAGVPWQTFQPPHLFLDSSSLHKLVRWDPSRPAQEQTLVPRFPIFSYLLLFPVIQPPYPSDLISPTQIAAFSFNPRFLFTISSVCCPNWTTWLCGLKSYKTPVGLSTLTVFPPLRSALGRTSKKRVLGWHKTVIGRSLNSTSGVTQSTNRMVNAVTAEHMAEWESAIVQWISFSEIKLASFPTAFQTTITFFRTSML